MAEELTAPSNEEGYVLIDAGDQKLDGNLRIPHNAYGVVVFIHGSGHGRVDPRNLRVAEEVRQGGLATLLVNLITEQELGDTREEELATRFDLKFLTRRIAEVTKWVRQEPLTQSLKIGYFAASTAAAPAIAIAAEHPDVIRAIVCCDGRPDLVPNYLEKLQTPTLLIVGEGEAEVHFLNRQALERMSASEKNLVQIAGGFGQLEAPGERDELARLATDWFKRFITAGAAAQRPEAA